MMVVRQLMRTATVLDNPHLERVRALHVHAVDEQPLVHRVIEVVAVDGAVGDSLASCRTGRGLKARRGRGDVVLGGGAVASAVERDNYPIIVLSLYRGIWFG